MLTAQREMPAIEATFDRIIAQASRRVAERDGDEIPIDCSAITMIQSSMLDRLIRLHLDAQRCGVRVILENVNDFVFEVITLTRLDRMLRIRVDDDHSMPPENHLSSPAR